MSKLKDITGMQVSQLMALLQEELPEVPDYENMQMALWLWVDMKLQRIIDGAANFKETQN
jgi:hypothetical protein